MSRRLKNPHLKRTAQSPVAATQTIATPHATPSANNTHASPNKSLILTILPVLATCFAAAFAGWAAWETHNSAAETARATRASIWMQMLSEYASPEMLSDMKILRAWERKDPVHFKERFRALLTDSSLSEEDAKLEQNLDSARRRIGNFFRKLQVLSQLDILEESTICINWNAGTYTFIRDVLIPMEQAKSMALLDAGSINTSNGRDSARKLNQLDQFYHRAFSACGSIE